MNYFVSLLDMQLKSECDQLRFSLADGMGRNVEMDYQLKTAYRNKPCRPFQLLRCQHQLHKPFYRHRKILSQSQETAVKEETLQLKPPLIKVKCRRNNRQTLHKILKVCKVHSLRQINSNKTLRTNKLNCPRRRQQTVTIQVLYWIWHQ